jgi:hypothetical protein
MYVAGDFGTSLHIIALGGHSDDSLTEWAHFESERLQKCSYLYTKILNLREKQHTSSIVAV